VTWLERERHIGECSSHRETVVADSLAQFCDAGSGGSAYQYVLDAIEFHLDSTRNGP
jgi:hypothetical protein